ncbi:Sugar (and other) transporter [Rhizoctonia solani]|uniref:Sugar (And other) transporter n=1 Tax=Rhizoctonia solani TaxID=456999 RepID=A0A8H8NQU5_9AGAM|nr:Sugar (and other) transporter [Rhizoctonia solani]QRW18214.1 Sugar (and other) transporter [Rhizoctonia solani]
MSTAVDEKHSASSSSSANNVPAGKNPNAMTYDERRRAALREVDEAKFSRFHVKACLVAGVGFFTDAYDIFAINIAATMLGFVYGKGGALNANQDLGVKVATPVGTLVGQLLFGWLADVVGRKKMYGVELMISFVRLWPAVGIVGAIIVWRFIMGVGIGGDYPLSAVITSEFAATRIRGRMMTAVFAMQGFGNFTAALVALIVTEAYKSSIINGPADLHKIDYCWRILIGLGAVPGCAANDVSIVVTNAKYKHDPDAVIERVQAPKASWADFSPIGAAYAWFALDVAFYGLGLNSSIVLTAIGFGNSTNGNKQVGAYETLHNVSVGNLILSAGGLIPGYWVTFLFVDSWGRKPIQLLGFTMLTIIFICMGFGYDKMIHTTSAAKKAFVFLYCFANFFQNFGPNTTTFIVPGEAFPTRYRSTAHGISAASGKLGAIIAQVGFARLRDIGGKNAFIKHILEIFALFMLTGLFATFLIPETKGRTLEDLSNESQDGFVSGGAGPLELRDGVVVDPRTDRPVGVVQPVQGANAQY